MDLSDVIVNSSYIPQSESDELCSWNLSMHA